MSKNKQRVILADKNKSYLVALQQFIQKKQNLNAINLCETLKEVNHKLDQEEANLLIIDEGVFENQVTTEIQRINRRFPKLKIVSLSQYGSDYMKKEIIEAGAYSYVSKWDIEKELPLIISLAQKASTK